LEKSEILEFVRRMKAKEHVIMFYTKPEDKRLVLFTYLKAGLDQGEAALYVTGQESPDEIRRAMRQFSIDVERFEKLGALHVIDSNGWYFIGGKFNVSKTMELLRKLYNEALAKGFKGLRGAGEMTCFFENRMVKELVEYENSLHKVLELPVTAICAYDSELAAKERGGQLYLDLIKAHSTVIIVGPEGGVVKSH